MLYYIFSFRHVDRDIFERVFSTATFGRDIHQS